MLRYLMCVLAKVHGSAESKHIAQLLKENTRNLKKMKRKISKKNNFAFFLSEIVIRRAIYLCPTDGRLILCMHLCFFL